jgi:hypothetical protein
LNEEQTEEARKIQGMSIEQLEKENLTLDIPTKEKISSEEAERLKEGFEEIQSKLKEAREEEPQDLNEIGRIQEEWKRAVKNLMNECGINAYVGKDDKVYFRSLVRKDKKATSRRVAIKLAIDQVRNKIKKDSPKLYEHLEKYIKTGEYCIYTLNPDIFKWYVSPY